MRKNKVGSIFLLSMLAMAGLGISYAGFTDMVYVSGTIDTATVQLEYISISHTYAWKVMYTGPQVDPPFIEGVNVVEFEWDPDNEWCWMVSYEATTAADVETWFEGTLDLVEDVTYWRVAWAEANIGEDDHNILVDFHNIFPCSYFRADFMYHYTGSIPAKLTASDIIMNNIVNGPNYPAGENWMEDLWDLDELYYTAYKVTPHFNNDGEVYASTIIEEIYPGYQVHNCDYLIIVIWMHLPQNNIWQGCSGEFSIDLGAIQWYDPCPPGP